MLSCDLGGASSEMVILKLDTREAEDLGVYSHRPRLAQTRMAAACTGSSLAVAVTLTSGQQSHRKQPWEGEEDWGLQGGDIGLGGKSPLSLKNPNTLHVVCF